MAVAVFRQKGYDAGSLDDVASALGLRKASLYYYIPSKAALLYLVFDRAISGALETMEVIVATTPPRQRLAELIRHQITTVASDPHLFAVFFDQRPRLAPDYEEIIHSKERRYLALFVDAVRAAVDSGELNVNDPRQAAQLLLGMANWTYKWFDERFDNIADVADTAVSLTVGRDRPSFSG